MMTFRLKHRRSFPFLFALLAGVLIACGGPSNGPPSTDDGAIKGPGSEPPRQPATRIPSELKIISVDGAPVEPGKTPHVGLRVLVEGEVSDQNAIVCLAVHPMSANTWWVQSLPSPPDRIGDSYRWRISALCGTAELGRGEEFELVALAEASRNICQAGSKFETEEFPDMARSEIVRVRRTKD